MAHDFAKQPPTGMRPPSPAAPPPRASSQQTVTVRLDPEQVAELKAALAGNQQREITIPQPDEVNSDARRLYGSLLFLHANCGEFQILFQGTLFCVIARKYGSETVTEAKGFTIPGCVDELRKTL